jgi:hypothetical protein
MVIQVNAIYEIDEQIEDSNKLGSRKLADLQGAIIVLHKKIAELECPRDDSLDNSVVVWQSQAFSIGSAGATSADGGSGSVTSGDSSVPAICSLIEDQGLTVRRCCDPEEAISRARDLQEEGLLRCLIVGGEEKGMSCGPSCVKKHTNTKCLRCGLDWEEHTGHECNIGGRGTWPLDKPVEGEKKITTIQIMKTLTDVESPYARAHAPLQAARTAVYSAHSSMQEEERMEFWKLGTTVTDDSKQLLAWINAMPGWNTLSTEEEEAAAAAEAAAQAAKAAEEANAPKAPFKRPVLRRQSSHNERTQLAAYKEELEALEVRKAAIADEDEVSRKKLLHLVAEKHALLETSVQQRIAYLTAAAASFQGLLTACKVDAATVALDCKAQYVGPQSGREACYAMGWLNHYGARYLAQGAAGEEVGEDIQKLISKHSVSVNNELSFLKRMALAAKVVAHVTSPMHKKLLNLCHNWLRYILIFFLIYLFFPIPFI